MSAESLLDGSDDTPVSHEMRCEFESRFNDAIYAYYWYSKSPFITSYQIIGDELVINDEKRIPIVEKRGKLFAATLTKETDLSRHPRPNFNGGFDISETDVINFITDYENKRVSITMKRTVEQKDGAIQEKDGQWTITCF